MSHGGGESGSRHTLSNAKRKFGGDDFSQAIAKVSVAQICERVGFQSFQQSALGTLADIAVRYIHSTGKAANFYANVSGRAHGNAFDVFQGLEDLGSAQGFSGASDIDHCLASSGIVRELIQYSNEATDVPFAYAIPRFPVMKDRNPKSSFSQIGEEPPTEDIPDWLTAFPDPQTYLELSTQNETAGDSCAEKIEVGRQQRKTKMSILSLQQRLSGDGQERPPSIVRRDSFNEKQTAETNPFLSAPLHFEEKEVSPVALPAKLSKEVALKSPATEKHVMSNHISVMEPITPALEAMKNTLCEYREEQKSIQLNQRSPVQFKIGIGKKSVFKPLKRGPQNMDSMEFTPWFCEENDKDEEERRAEEILKDSMKNAHELAQM